MILKESLSENDDAETNTPMDTLDSSLVLFDALKPVTFDGCCPEDAANPYVKVCLTENKLVTRIRSVPFQHTSKHNYSKSMYLLARKRINCVANVIKPMHSYDHQTSGVLQVIPTVLSHFHLVVLT